jgi:hypothetical protein
MEPLVTGPEFTLVVFCEGEIVAIVGGGSPE